MFKKHGKYMVLQKYSIFEGGQSSALVLSNKLPFGTLWRPGRRRDFAAFQEPPRRQIESTFSLLFETPARRFPYFSER